MSKKHGRQDSTAGRTEKQASPRKPYTPPVLKEYGDIAKLTQGAGTQNGDAGTMTMG